MKISRITKRKNSSDNPTYLQSNLRLWQKILFHKNVFFYWSSKFCRLETRFSNKMARFAKYETRFVCETVCFAKYETRFAWKMVNFAKYETRETNWIFSSKTKLVFHENLENYETKKFEWQPYSTVDILTLWVCLLSISDPVGLPLQ